MLQAKKIVRGGLVAFVGPMQSNVPRNFIPEPFPYHHELVLEIDTLTNLGHGLGRVDGWVVMVPFALPGEKVRVRIFRNHKNYSEADLLEVLEASPERLEPRCPLFGECGGCQYQHFSYRGQLEWKRQQVVEVLERIGGIKVPVEPTHPSPRQYHYRSKLTPHYQGKSDPSLAVGFLRNGRGRQLVDVPSCPIATEAINEALSVEREKIRAVAKKAKRGGTLLLRHTLEGVSTDNNQRVSEKVGSLVLYFLAGDFFQNNPYILPEMVEYVLSQARTPSVHYLVDAYCGVGLFALSGSSHFRRVLGVEVNQSAVQWAENNAKANHIHNAAFKVGKAESIFAQVEFSPDETAIIIDPPRAGCDEAFIRQLLDYGPARLVYVSCDPSTQARDLKGIVAGGYRIERVQPFDLFPQTRHIENVVTLSKSKD